MKINIHNYEEYLLSYVDHELDSKDVQEIQQFLKQYPELQKELELLEATKLSVEDKSFFPDKSALYKKEKNTHSKIFSLHFYKRASMVAAACLIFCLTLYLYSQNQNNAVHKTAVNSDTVIQKENPLLSEYPSKQDPALFKINPQQGTAIKRGMAFNKSITKNNHHNKPVREIRDTLQDKTGLAATSYPAIPEVTPLTELHVAHENNIVKQAVLVAKTLPEVQPESEEKSVHLNQIKKDEPAVVNKINGIVEIAATTKDKIHNTFSQKITDLNKKKDKLFNRIAHNGLRIGNVTIALNE